MKAICGIGKVTTRASDHAKRDSNVAEQLPYMYGELSWRLRRFDCNTTSGLPHRIRRVKICATEEKVISFLQRR